MKLCFFLFLSLLRIFLVFESINLNLIKIPIVEVDAGLGLTCSTEPGLDSVTADAEVSATAELLSAAALIEAETTVAEAGEAAVIYFLYSLRPTASKSTKESPKILFFIIIT